MKNNQIQNEIDILTEIYNDLTYCESVLKDTLAKNKISQLDQQFALNTFKNEINVAINTALLNDIHYNFFDYNNIKNKILPNNYLKPNEQILDLINKINKLNSSNLNKLEKQVNILLKEQAND